MGGFPGPRRVEERLKRWRQAGQEWLLISDRIAHGQAEEGEGRLGMPASVAANSAAKGGGSRGRGGYCWRGALRNKKYFHGQTKQREHAIAKEPGRERGRREREIEGEKLKQKINCFVSKINTITHTRTYVCMSVCVCA